MSTGTLSSGTLSSGTLITGTSDPAALRARIDALDAELLRLVRERSDVSAQIGAARRASGGPRIVHARENEVVGRWRSALGRPGAAIAMALLELGRGPA